MTSLYNLLVDRLSHLDFTNPLSLLDLIIAISLIVGTLVYLSRFSVFRVVLGTLFLFGCAILFLLGGFLLTGLLFVLVANLILISLPLIFAPEVRHYLEKLGRFPFLHLPSVTTTQKTQYFVRNLVGAVYELAERKTGALIVLARKAGLGETIETGVIIDAKFGSKLLSTIFFNKSPLHDGAVVIKNSRILAASCLLPLRGEVKLDPPFGTRHKSGLSLTQDTDAVVIIISEQRGEVSLAENGKLEINLDRGTLIQKLNKLLG
ncbi:MAG: DNA integrity scanning protein DisA nucleotide-binding domain protein [Candidatus Daviesbacteria bacterium]|nr:MAG: DNA integrity scanning protein DisA nucleotide-binding domain protein [Candidatus Daviesbacteria bacterium]